MAAPTSYPDNLSLRVAALEKLVERLLYSAQAREPYTRLVARQLTVGQDSPNRRLVFNPDSAAAGAAAIWMYPDHVNNPTTLSAEANASYPSEATFEINSGVNQANTASSLWRLASGEIFMGVFDETGADNNGGYAYWGTSQAKFGFVNNSSGDNYFVFNASSLSRHFGRWDDFGSQPSNSGQLWGSLTTASGTSHTVSYPSTMDSNMGPIFGLRTGSGTANAKWSITASSTSSVTMTWDTSQSVALYMLSFRH